MTETWTELVHEMHAMGTRTGECLGLLQKAFIFSDREALNLCVAQLSAIRTKELEISKKIADAARQDTAKGCYSCIPKHFLEICRDLEVLAGMLQKKITEKILFSDRAITEVSFLSQSLLEILNAATDLVLVKNPILIRYVQEAEAMIEKATNQYATHHEERLIEGLCLQVSSSVFLRILENFRGIARAARHIAECMAQ